MSIAAHVIGEVALGGQPAVTASSTGKPPRRRQITAKADAVQLPEAR